jgi:ribosome maturation factor RimP
LDKKYKPLAFENITEGVNCMTAKPMESLVEKIVLEIIQGSSLELVDVEYVKERDWYLRVFLDKPNGLEIEDCQWVSEKLEDILEQTDPIKERYILEVSSPGIDRVLKKEKDFIRHIGQAIEIHTFAPLDGKKMLIGTLIGRENDEISINTQGTLLKIPQGKVSLVRLHVEF